MKMRSLLSLTFHLRDLFRPAGLMGDHRHHRIFHRANQTVSDIQKRKRNHQSFKQLD